MLVLFVFALARFRRAARKKSKINKLHGVSVVRRHVRQCGIQFRLCFPHTPRTRNIVCEVFLSALSLIQMSLRIICTNNMLHSVLTFQFFFSSVVLSIVLIPPQRTYYSTLLQLIFHEAHLCVVIRFVLTVIHHRMLYEYQSLSTQDSNRFFFAPIEKSIALKLVAMNSSHIRTNLKRSH